MYVCILCIYDNLQIGCKFTNDKGTLHWSHTEPLIRINRPR